MASALVLLADGFEEIEALTAVDLLRRAGVAVTTAAVTCTSATGSHGISVHADASLDQVADQVFEMVVLPGGMPGSATLRQHETVQSLIRRMWSENHFVAAICAAPMALAAAGILAGRRYTCYPGALGDFPDLASTGEPVVRDGKLITARGPGVAMDFALELIRALVGDAEADRVEAGLQR